MPSYKNTVEEGAMPRELMRASKVPDWYTEGDKTSGLVYTPMFPGSRIISSLNQVSVEGRVETNCRMGVTCTRSTASSILIAIVKLLLALMRIVFLPVDVCVTVSMYLPGFTFSKINPPVALVFAK